MIIARTPKQLQNLVRSFLYRETGTVLEIVKQLLSWEAIDVTIRLSIIFCGEGKTRGADNRAIESHANRKAEVFHVSILF